MIIVCEKCNTKNKLPDSLGSEEFANAKCGKCGFFFAKKPEEKFENNAANTQNVRSSKIADDFITYVMFIGIGFYVLGSIYYFFVLSAEFIDRNGFVAYVFFGELYVTFLSMFWPFQLL